MFDSFIHDFLIFLNRCSRKVVENEVFLTDENNIGCHEPISLFIIVVLMHLLAAKDSGLGVL
jgi:hypothetical protein